MNRGGKVHYKQLKILFKFKSYQRFCDILDSISRLEYLYGEGYIVIIHKFSAPAVLIA